MIRDIFSVGISIFELTNLNNNEIAEYAKTKLEKNQSKENKDILTNNIFKSLNKVVLEKMNEYYSSIYNDNFKIKLNVLF